MIFEEFQIQTGSRSDFFTIIGSVQYKLGSNPLDLPFPLVFTITRAIIMLLNCLILIQKLAALSYLTPVHQVNLSKETNIDSVL